MPEFPRLSEEITCQSKKQIPMKWQVGVGSLHFLRQTISIEDLKPYLFANCVIVSSYVCSGNELLGSLFEKVTSRFLLLYPVK